MRYAVLGDIHANWEALSAVLEDAAAQGVGAYLCVGDLVGYNADPARCIETVRAIGCVAVRGNHDHFAFHPLGPRDMTELAAGALAWTRRQLSEEQARFLGNLPFQQTVGDFSLVHSTLDRSVEWQYVMDAPDAAACLASQRTPLCFHGHTHIPVVFHQRRGIARKRLRSFQIARGTRYLVNVGSVGQPRDGDPRAAYAIYDTDARTLLARRVVYDVATAQRKVAAAGLPEFLALRLQFGV
jgi:diadenosine tetraphosphatase ApaH/serine/threonine PP2A family protein phosphatase